MQDFSSKNTCAWIPTAAGTYNFYCDIKDASGAVVSCKRMTFNITNPYSFTADKATTQSVGTKITFTATGGYQYKFYYEKDGSWVRIQSFSTSDTCAWTPTVAGRYNVYCDIADENGTVLAYKGMEFVIGDAGTTDYTFHHLFLRKLYDKGTQLSIEKSKSRIIRSPQIFLNSMRC